MCRVFVYVHAFFPSLVSKLSHLPKVSVLKTSGQLPNLLQRLPHALILLRVLVPPDVASTL